MRSDQADFRILGETREFIAVEKPAGVLVHPTRPGGPRTLWDALRDLLSYEVATGGQVSIINRLDRETSGVVLVAKSAAAARRAAMTMQAGGIRKTYLAILDGHPREDSFTIDQPIVRRGAVVPSPIHLQRMVHPSGARAVTGFRILRRFGSGQGIFSLAMAFPATGRTHQIRVHAAHAGHHLVGDKIYGPSEQCYLEFIRTGWTESLAARLLLPRHALHSASIAFEGEGRSFSWESPLPEDLAAFINREPPSPPP